MQFIMRITAGKHRCGMRAPGGHTHRDLQRYRKLLAHAWAYKCMHPNGPCLGPLALFHCIPVRHAAAGESAVGRCMHHDGMMAGCHVCSEIRWIAGAITRRTLTPAPAGATRQSVLIFEYQRQLRAGPGLGTRSSVGSRPSHATSCACCVCSHVARSHAALLQAQHPPQARCQSSLTPASS